MKPNGRKLIFSVCCAFLGCSCFAFAAPVVLVPTNAVWKYRADGVDLGSVWQANAYDDSTWLAGAAQLGYGDGDETTIVGSGPDAAAKYITTYFRKSFTLPGPPSAMTLRLLRDDGAVVYVNGTEVFRNNMPAGPIAYNTLATVAVGGVDETTFIESVLPLDPFVVGNNVVAVEVHQVNATSSDMSFALELDATLAPPGPQVSVTAVDAEAREISPLLDIPENPAVFRISRTGPTNTALGVGIRMSGTASNGVDYSFVPNVVTIPAGSAFADVVISVLDDTITEGTESVILSLIPTPCLECYVVSSNSTATAFILDNETVTNQRPTVSILSPADGSKFTLPTNILLRASASDPEDGNDILVEFYMGTLRIGTATFVPTLCPSPECPYYAFVWSNAPAGTLPIFAIATDKAGARTVSAPVNITVSPAPNQPPTVTIVSPTNGAVFQASTSIFLLAGVHDPDGLARNATLQIFANNQSLGYAQITDPGPEHDQAFRFDWTNALPGNYTLTATATDSQGAATSSAPINITVLPASNQPPTVSIASPTNGAVFPAATPILLLAGVHDPDGLARNATLQIFANNQSLGYAQITDPGPEHDQAFRFIWTNALPGEYTITAVGTDAQGLSATSSPVRISVQQVQPPSTQHELHAIGIYSGNYNGGSSPNHLQGQASVLVNRPGTGVTLFLSAYEPVLWHVATTNGTVIEKVILGGYYRQAIDGLPSGVPVVTRYYDEGAGTSDYLWSGYSIDNVQFLRTLSKLCDLTGMDLSSFQGTYTAPAPTPFVIAGVQSDPRLRCNYPQPVDPAGLPAITFDLSFLNLDSASGLYTRHYTLAGPQNGGRLLPGMKMVPDQSGQGYYGTESQNVYNYDSENSLTLVDLSSVVPAVSVPTGISFDSLRNRVLLVTLGGEGYLYGYATADQHWSVIGSMNNRDANGIAYHAATDSIYAVSTTHDDSQPRVLWQLNSSSQLLGQIPLPQMPFNFSALEYQSVLVSVGDYLVLLVEPAYKFYYGTSPAESRIYLIDPRTSQVWLTYRKPLLRDSDDDGVPDDQDQCPNTPRGEVVDAHGCGASQQDTDHDGVPNSLDECPNTPAGVTVDAHGCPRFLTCEPGIYWQVELGDAQNQQITKVHQTPDGGYIIGGQQWNLGKMWIVRLSATGAKVWEKSIGTHSADHLKDIQPVSAGGYIIAGSASTSGSAGNEAELVRIDANGTVLWAQTYGGTDLDSFEAIRETSDGGFIAAGGSQSPAGPGKSSPNFGKSDAWLVKLDVNGNKLWERTYGGTLVDYANSVRQTPDGGYLLGVSTESPVSGNKTLAGFGSFDSWILKLNANGDKVWDRVYGTTNNDGLFVVDVLPNGSALLTGYAGSPASGNKTSPGFGGSDAWVLLVDADGNTVWERTFGGDGFDILPYGDRMPDGGFILAGSSDSPPSGNKTSPKVAGNDFWLVRIDAHGDKLWERSIGGGGPYGSLANEVKRTTDGGFVVVGETFNDIGGDKTVPWYGSDDGWVVKLSPENNDCDGDGIPNNLDQCPNTPMGEVVNAQGCGISQLCPCDQGWRNHNEYVQCVSTNATQFLLAGLVTEARRNQIVQLARDSSCGRRHPRLIVPPQPAQAIRASGCNLLLDGDGPVTCVIECSENLLNWRPISTNILDGSQLTITDSDASNAQRRFYRIQPGTP